MAGKKPHIFVDFSRVAVKLWTDYPKSAEVLCYIFEQKGTVSMNEILNNVPGADNGDATHLNDLRLAYPDGAGYHLNKDGEIVAEYIKKHKIVP